MVLVSDLPRLLKVTLFTVMVQAYLLSQYFAMLPFFKKTTTTTNQSQDLLPAKRLQLTLLQYSLYCYGLELNLQYLEAMLVLSSMAIS